MDVECCRPTGRVAVDPGMVIERVDEMHTYAISTSLLYIDNRANILPWSPADFPKAFTYHTKVVLYRSRS